MSYKILKRMFYMNILVIQRKICYRLFIIIFISYSKVYFCPYLLDNDIITDAQFGFQLNRGTAEAIFYLSTIIDITLRKNK